MSRLEKLNMRATAKNFKTTELKKVAQDHGIEFLSSPFSVFSKYNRDAFAFYILLVNMAINSRLDRIRPVDGLLS